MLSIGLMHGVLAQSDPFNAPIYPERLHEDLAVLHRVIDEVHPDPYRYRSHEALNALFDSLELAIRVPMPAEAFAQVLLPVLEAVGDMHLRVDLPRTFEEHVDARVPLLPLDVRVVDGRILVENEPKGFRSFTPGVRILSINGISDVEILDRMRSVVVGDGANTTYAVRVIERDFRHLYFLHVERPREFHIRYEDLDGLAMETTIFGMTGSEIKSSTRPDGVPLLPWAAQWLPEVSTEWVTMRTLDLDTLMAEGQVPEKFLAALLRDLRRNNARTLVLDVRGAGGRDLGVAEQVFGAIAKAPYRMVQDIGVRCLELPEGIHWEDERKDHFATARARFPRQAADVFWLWAKDERLTEMPVAKRAFQGTVYIVCDGSTRDASAALVMLGKRTGRAKVVGEEVGTNATSFTGGRDLVAVAPNSGLRYTVPLMRYIPEGVVSGPPDHGEMPHRTAAWLAYGTATGRDSVKEALLMMIAELQ